MYQITLSECPNCKSKKLKWLQSFLCCCLDCGHIENVNRLEDGESLVATEPDRTPNPFPYSIAVHFSTSSESGIASISDDEWKWMGQQNRAFNKHFAQYDIGYSDGFGSGFGELDLHFFVNDIDTGFKIIREHLTEHELMGYCNSITCFDGNEAGEWKSIYQRK